MISRKLANSNFIGLHSMASVDVYNENKTYLVTALRGARYRVQQFINGVCVCATITDLYRASEMSWLSQQELTKIEPPKKLNREIRRRIKSCGFKFIGGLSIEEQQQIITLRKHGKSQQQIANEINTSRGSVIRVLKQSNKLLFVTDETTSHIVFLPLLIACVFMFACVSVPFIEYTLSIGGHIATHAPAAFMHWNDLYSLNIK